MVIDQGDIFWINFSPSKGSEPKGMRPALIIQRDSINQSHINTVIAIAITSNLKYANIPGNVRLYKGEANIPKSSVINITQIKTIDKNYLIEKIGKISNEKLNEVKEGLRLILDV